jgi:hypothetical protein
MQMSNSRQGQLCQAASSELSVGASHAQVVLSHYPASSEDLNDREVPRICNCTYLEDVGVWRLWEAENQLPPGQFVPVRPRDLQPTSY